MKNKVKMHCCQININSTAINMWQAEISVLLLNGCRIERKAP